MVAQLLDPDKVVGLVLRVAVASAGLAGIVGTGSHLVSRLNAPPPPPVVGRVVGLEALRGGLLGGDALYVRLPYQSLQLTRDAYLFVRVGRCYRFDPAATGPLYTAAPALTC